MNTLQWVRVPDTNFQGWPIYRSTLDGSLAYEADGERLVELPTRYLTDIEQSQRMAMQPLMALSNVKGFEGLKKMLEVTL